MTPPTNVNVAAILAAVYRRPIDQGAELATRVRSRLALMETVSEAVRLLVEAPAAAFVATVGDVTLAKAESASDE